MKIELLWKMLNTLSKLQSILFLYLNHSQEPFYAYQKIIWRENSWETNIKNQTEKGGGKKESPTEEESHSFYTSTE